MIEVKFKNLEKSELAREAVIERIDRLTEKFEALANSRIVVTLEMLNSPEQAGPDLFSVKLHVFNGKFDGATVNKFNCNLYKALADVVDHLLEKFNRMGDKKRVKERQKERKKTILVQEDLD